MFLVLKFNLVSNVLIRPLIMIIPYTNVIVYLDKILYISYENEWSYAKFIKYFIVCYE